MPNEYLNEKIAIILPVFNSSKYLKNCLESILSQTFKNFTIFAINDGSVDNSGKILDEYALRDSRITVIHKHNEGVGASRNYALNIIEKEKIFSYISFIDSDDIIAPTFLSSHLEYIKKTNADVSICSFSLMDEDGGLHQHQHPLSDRTFGGEEYINLIFSKKEWDKGSGAGGMVWKQLYRANAIHSIRFSEDPSIVEDELFGVMVAQKAKIFAYFPEPLYFYRQSNTSLCKDEYFQLGRLNGRKLCLNSCENVSEIARLVVFSSYMESILSLMKQETLDIDLNPYKSLAIQAYHSGAMSWKTFFLFSLFNSYTILSKAYICLRASFRKLRCFLRLRV